MRIKSGDKEGRSVPCGRQHVVAAARARARARRESTARPCSSDGSDQARRRGARACVQPRRRCTGTAGCLTCFGYVQTKTKVIRARCTGSLCKIHTKPVDRHGTPGPGRLGRPLRGSRFLVREGTWFRGSRLDSSNGARSASAPCCCCCCAWGQRVCWRRAMGAAGFAPRRCVRPPATREGRERGGRPGEFVFLPCTIAHPMRAGIIGVVCLDAR